MNKQIIFISGCFKNYSWLHINGLALYSCGSAYKRLWEILLLILGISMESRRRNSARKRSGKRTLVIWLSLESDFLNRKSTDGASVL